jgi:hypothetical protein
MTGLTMMTRQNHRKPLTLPGRYQIGQERGVEVALRDISPGGCRFDHGGANLVAGSRIKVHIGNAGPFLARVRWVRAGDAGVTFVSRLDQDQYDGFRNCHLTPSPRDDHRDGLADTDSAPGIQPRRYC